MTSTVVGSATLAALIAGYKAFDINNMPLATTSDEVEDIEPMTKYDLIQNDIHLGKADVNTAQLQALGARSARYCPCERQSRTKQKILRCVECGHTACSDCAGNPMHKFRSADLQRSDPLHFITLLKSILPPRLVFSGLSEADYEPLKLNEIGWSPDTWTEFLKSVMKAVGDELRLYEIKRSEAWTVVYNGRSSVLKLVIDTIVAWQLFAKPDDSAPVLSLARVILEKPIARMIPSGSILNGVWVVCTPLSSKREMTIHGAGTKGPSFEQMCGLKNPEHKDSKVWSELVVQGPDTTNDFDTDIRGEYTRLPYCGMAKGTLHKKAATADAPAVYLFLDPTKYGHQEGDMFVFSTDHRRITGHDPRLTIGEVSNKWVYPKATLEPQPVNIFHRSWAKVQTATMDIFAPDTSISRQTLKPGTRMSVGEDECRHANATITTFSIPETRMESSWQDGPWELIDSANTVSMPELFWLASKAADFPDFQHWNPVDIFEASRECGPCAECAPPKPGIMWDCKETCSKPYENPEEAALYERRVKAKPSPFLVYRRMEDGLARFAVSLNIQTLLHQAHARLGGGLSANASYSWRLVPDAYDPKPLLPKFQLIGNKETAPALPSRFKLSLRPEQQRSLSWMISQEADIPPFVEEETEEAFLPLTMWRAECRVTAPKHVRGGIIADEVGYGKTAIVLALIATQSVEEPKRVDGFIPSKATLLIVPGVLVSQWHSEIVRFMDIEPKDVLILQDVAAVAKTRIADIREAKIILVPSIMFTGQAYPNRMSEFTGMPQAPTKGGRNFDRWFRDAQGSLNELANVLMNRGPSELLAAIHAKREAAAFKNTEFIYEPSKRLRGKAYEEAHQNPGPKDGGVSSKSSKGRTPKSQGQRQVEFNISTTHQNKVDDVQIPVLHAFSFNRLVIDEFTYADSEKLGLFFALQARSKWIISGTPPLNDFAGVNTISPFLGVHLGIADDELNLTARRQKSELGVEKLQAFKERHSGAWHLNRHQIAQRFLDRFARRNIAEIGEIPSTEHVVLVSQSPAETALYLELVARLMTQRDQYRRLGKIRNDDDRLSRLREMIEPSTAPKEALVRRGSSSVLEDRWKDKKPESITIGSLIGIRKAEIGRLQELFGKTMAQASWIHTHKDVDGEAYKNLIEDVYHNLFGNRTLRVNVFETVKESVRVSTVSGLQGNGWKENADPKEIGESGGPLMNFLAEYQETQSETSGEATSSRQFEYDGDSSEDEAESKDGKEPESPAEFAAANKRICGKLRRMMRRWVSQVGALRFLESFQHVQLTAAIPKCDSCGSRPAALDKTNILGSCGHILCEACMLKATDSETCAVKECTASGKESEVVSGQEISQREDQAAKYGGSKMEKLVEIIQSTPENERVLLFIQFPEIVNVASKVLDLAGIKYKTITSDSHELFQQTGKPLAKLHKLKVLILKVGTETAAGL